MSSSESERRKPRGDSGNKQKSTASPRHFREDKASKRKAPEPAAEPASEEAAFEEPAAENLTEEPVKEAPKAESTASDQPAGEVLTDVDADKKKLADNSSGTHEHSHHSDTHHSSSHHSSSHHSSSHHSSSHHSSSHHSSGQHHHHHSSGASTDNMISIWDVDHEGEKGWTSTAYSNTKKARSTGRSLDVVAPVEKEHRAKPVKMDTGRAPETTFDYVAPKQTFDQHRKHPEKSTLHSGKTKKASREEVEEAEEGFVFRSLKDSDKRRRRRRHHHHHHSSSQSSSGAGSKTKSGGSGSSGSKKRHHHHHHHMPKWAKITLIVLAALLGIAIILGIVYFVMYQIGGSVYQHNEIAIVAPTTATEDEPVETIDVIDNGRTVVYQGKTYRFNEKIAIVGFVGVNYNYEDQTMHAMGDAVDLIAFDPSIGKLTVIAVSRDAMADVNVYSDEGNSIDVEKMQLAYAYYYGDVSRKTTGGKNIASALSRLFYGLPVDDYFAMNLDALMSLNDAIGGVTLTFTEDFSTPIRDISAGETVTLFGTEVEYFVRYRDTENVEGNSERMDRQQQYIRAFLEQVIPAVRKDPLSKVTDLYNIVKANSNSSLDLTEIVRLATDLVTNLKSTDSIEYLTLGGKAVKGKDHTEFIVDDANALETLIKVFYQPVE